MFLPRLPSPLSSLLFFLPFKLARNRHVPSCLRVKRFAELDFRRKFVFSRGDEMREKREREREREGGRKGGRRRKKEREKKKREICF